MATLRQLVNERILILDGAMGTMIQQYNLSEQDFRGERFAQVAGQMKGNNDLLCLTRPEVIKDIHRKYLEAGADIIETNTFNAQRVSMADYHIEEACREINLAAARLARELADEYTARNPRKPRFVAGAVGPTNKTCSMSPDVNNPASRALTYDGLVAAYTEQMEALLEGGVDAILIETIFDTLNAKAAIFAAETAMQKCGRELPLMLSVTVSDVAGRTLSGQTLDAFLASVQHAPIFSIGLNCSFGARQLKPFLARLAARAPYYISAYPNAGLPNSLGQYDQTPDEMASEIKEYIDEGLVNVIGGCCGTTEAYIAQYQSLIKADVGSPHLAVSPGPADALELAEAGEESAEASKESLLPPSVQGENSTWVAPHGVGKRADMTDFRSGSSTWIAPHEVRKGADMADFCSDSSTWVAPHEVGKGAGMADFCSDSSSWIAPHIPAKKPERLWLSGLELLEQTPEINFINVGERCNVAGSRKFLRLINEKKYEEALSIARKQVEDGAQIIDVNMDDGLLDAREEMVTFLNLVMSEPDIACVPIMIDSSKWEVIEAGLKCLQGKSIVNSISLKEGEEKFIARARLIKKLGAAAVVMAFDEKGQADSYERKIEVCARAYRILTDRVGFHPYDIIFDPNVLAVATGIEEHNNYAVDFIRATAWIRKNLPGAHVSGGVSNLSFSFRGNNYIREAMHAVFLYHAIQQGMDMGIVNPATSVLYTDIPADVLERIEDVVLNRRPDAAERLIETAEALKNKATGAETVHQDAWRAEPEVEKRLQYALIKGIGDYLEEDLAEAVKRYPKAVDIIEGPLMEGMNEVGEMFGAGKMFLPQVVKTARTMKKAVAILQPLIEADKQEGARSAGKVLMATVKGDVHDIGKNIVSVVMACNNYEIIDLGVMVPAETIVQKAIEEKVDIVGLSGLITPSLEEMAHVAMELQRAGLDIPIMIGGATTSKLHTALKIAPVYAGPVVHMKDASQNALVAARLLNAETRREFVEGVNKEYEELRRKNSAKQVKTVSLEEAQKNKLNLW